MTKCLFRPLRTTVLASVAVCLSAAAVCQAQVFEVDSFQKISDTAGGFIGTLVDDDWFGTSVAFLGDLDGEGGSDCAIAVGEQHDDDANSNAGAVWILFLDSNGFVVAERKITTGQNGFTDNLGANWDFGHAIASLGDLDGNTVPDLAVSSDEAGSRVWIIFLNDDGTVLDHFRIGPSEGGFGGNVAGSRFGSSIAAIGDIDGPGGSALAIAVGAPWDSDGGAQAGAVWILRLAPSGFVLGEQKISATSGGFAGLLDADDRFGTSVAPLGDFNNDTRLDIVVGAFGDDDAGDSAGTAWLVYLDDVGMVVDEQKISPAQAAFQGGVSSGDSFGTAIANMGDLDGDGVTDLSIGAPGDDDNNESGQINTGAVWVLFLNSDGTVRHVEKISDTAGGFQGGLDIGDTFGSSVANLGFLRDSTTVALGVGANLDDDGGPDRGAAWILFVPTEPLVSGERLWNNPAGGDYGDPLNWTPPFVPIEQAKPVFDLHGMYTVTLDVSRDAGRLIVNDDDVTLDLNGEMLDLTAAKNAGLVVGQFFPDDAQLKITNGAMTSFAARIAAGSRTTGHLIVSGPGASYSSLSSFCIGCVGLSSGSLTIENGGYVFSRDAEIGDLPGASGTVRVTGAGSLWEIFFILEVDQDAHLIVESGGTVTTDFGVFVFASGMISGDGTINGDVINFGEMNMGQSVGTLTINGDYVQVRQSPQFGDASGTLVVEFEDDQQGGIAHDVLDVSGDVTLGGGLVVQRLDQVDPLEGAMLDFITSSSVTGAFDVALLPGLASEKFMRVEYGTGPGGNVSLTVETLESLFGFGDPESFNVTGTPTDVATGDLDGDNDLDLAVLLAGNTPQDVGAVLVIRNGGFDEGTGAWIIEGTSQTPVGREPTGIAIGSFNSNGDSHLDVAVSNAGDNNVFILKNTGDGMATFVDPPQMLNAGERPSDVITADLDGDLINDLAVANEVDSDVYVFGNGGLGDFTLLVMLDTGGLGARRLEPSDLEEDKDFDIVGVAEMGMEGGPNGVVFVLENNGNATFQPAFTLQIGVDPNALAIADLDDNTFPDVVVTNGGDATVSVLLNNGTVQFSPAVALPVGANPRSITTIDLELDGDVDIALVAEDEQSTRVVQVLRNDQNQGQHLIFADAADLLVGDDPLFVLSGDLDGDTVDDLIAVNEGIGGEFVGTDQPARGSMSSANVLVNAFDARTVAPSDFNVVFGTYISGTTDDLRDSDDRYVEILQNTSLPDLFPSIRVEVTGVSRIVSASELSVTVEAALSVPPRPGIQHLTQRLSLFNHDAGQWEIVDERPASGQDSVATVTIVTDPQRFIEQTTGDVAMRIDWFDPGDAFTTAAGTASIDQAIWRVEP